MRDDDTPREAAVGIDGGDATGGGSPGDPDAMGGHNLPPGEFEEQGLVTPGNTIGQNPPPGGDRERSG